MLSRLQGSAPGGRGCSAGELLVLGRSPWSVVLPEAGAAYQALRSLVMDFLQEAAGQAQRWLRQAGCPLGRWGDCSRGCGLCGGVWLSSQGSLVLPFLAGGAALLGAAWRVQSDHGTPGRRAAAAVPAAFKHLACTGASPAKLRGKLERRGFTWPWRPVWLAPCPQLVQDLAAAPGSGRQVCMGLEAQLSQLPDMAGQSQADRVLEAACVQRLKKKLCQAKQQHSNSGTSSVLKLRLQQISDRLEELSSPGGGGARTVRPGNPVCTRWSDKLTASGVSSSGTCSGQASSAGARAQRSGPARRGNLPARARQPAQGSPTVLGQPSGSSRCRAAAAAAAAAAARRRDLQVSGWRTFW